MARYQQRLRIKPEPKFPYDFFVSRRRSAAPFAQEVANVLKRANYKVIVEDFDFPFADNFVGEMHDAVSSARHFIGLLTEDYATSPFTRAEWTSFFALAAVSAVQRRLIILRVENVDPPGLLAPIVYGDLFNVSQPEREGIILAAVRGQSTGFRKETRAVSGVPDSTSEFVGRDNLLNQLAEALSAGDQPTAITQAAVHGLGGIGKTTLAAEYAHRTYHQYAGVWWILAENRSVLIASLAALAVELDPCNRTVPDLETAAKQGLEQLSQSDRPWLLVYDNVPSPSALEGWLPASGARILITTRFPDWAGRATAIVVDALDAISATRFLLRRAASTDREGASRLARTLGYLPLALDHAGAYVKTSGISFSHYEEMLTTLVSRIPTGVTYPRSVAATFEIALESAVAKSPVAEALLATYSVLDSDRIPNYCINNLTLSDKEQFEARKALSDVSLIRPSNVHGVPVGSVHRLVQLVMRSRLRAGNNLVKTIESAIAGLVRAYPRDEFGKTVDRPRHRQILPHAIFLRKQCDEAGIDGPLVEGLSNLIFLLEQMNAQLDIEDQYRKAVALSISTFGERHPEVASRYHDLADFLRDQGQHGDAEQYYRGCAEISKTTAMPRGTTVALSCVSLADLLRTMGRYHEAEPLLRDLPKSLRTNTASDARDAITRLNGLGNLCRDTGKFIEAKNLFRKAIEIGTRVLGRRDPYVGTCLSNLAATLTDLEQYDEAQTSYEEALKIKSDQRQGVGSTHLSYAMSISGFARLNQEIGRHSEADRLHQEAIGIAERASNGGQPYLARFRTKYSQFLVATGRRREAVDEAKRALASHDNLLGPAHQWTKQAAAALADALSVMGRERKAAEVRKRYKIDARKTQRSHGSRRSVEG